MKLDPVILDQLDNNFYKFDRDKYINSKVFLKRLSNSEIQYEYLLSEEEFLKEAIRFLKRNAEKLFTFITGEKICSVELNQEDDGSYCSLTSNKIKVSLKLLFDLNLPRQFRVDCINGILLHEMFHKRFTITSISELLHIDRNKYYEHESVIKTGFINKHIKTKLEKIVLNILEDRRIEKLGIEDFPGYGFYFDELRKYGFIFNYNRNYSLGDRLITFLIIKILVPEISKRVYDAIEPIYDEIVYDLNKYIDDNIKEDDYRSFDRILYHLHAIVQLIPKIIKEEIEKNLEDFGDNKTEPSEVFCNEPFPFKLSKDEKQKIEKALEQIEGEENDKEEKNNNPIIEKIDVKFEWEKFKDIEIITPKLVPINTEIYSKSLKVSNILKSKFIYLDSKFKRQEEEYELTEGDIDEEELFSINYNKNIFKEDIDIRDYNLDIAILLDESGSMSNYINEAITATLSLMLALQYNKKVKLLVYGHSSMPKAFTVGKGAENTLFKYYDSWEGLTNIERLFNAKSRHSNADGFSIQYIGEQLIKKSKSKNKLLIVISDGQPAANGYMGDSAIKHTKEEVEKLESNGVFVIQVCINNIKDSNLMFKHFVEYSNDVSFTKNFINVINKQLVKIFNSV